MLSQGNRPLQPFPSPERANADGLLAIGGDLRPERLLLAYRSGIFPWFEEGLAVHWWSPDPRAILEFDQLHVSRRLQRTLRQGRFQVTTDRCFERAMRACGEEREEGTWITESMVQGYCALHRIGHAHSLEMWSGEELVGGIYGVSIGGYFSAESMFHRRRDASKIALVHLVRRLFERGFVLLDLQILNEHTARLGATEIRRSVFLDRLRRAVELPVKFGD